MSRGNRGYGWVTGGDGAKTGGSSSSDDDDDDDGSYWSAAGHSAARSSLRPRRRRAAAAAAARRPRVRFAPTPDETKTSEVSNERILADVIEYLWSSAEDNTALLKRVIRDTGYPSERVREVVLDSRHLTSFSGKVVLRCDDLQVCWDHVESEDGYCDSKTRKCGKFHICPKFLKGECPLVSDDCDLGHSFLIEPNRALVKENGLRSLSERTLMALLAETVDRRNDESSSAVSGGRLLPEVCDEYNRHGGNCQGGRRCQRLHICSAHVFADQDGKFCTQRSCPLNHKASSPDVARLLAAAGIDTNAAEKEIVLLLRKNLAGHHRNDGPARGQQTGENKPAAAQRDGQNRNLPRLPRSARDSSDPMSGFEASSFQEFRRSFISALIFRPELHLVARRATSQAQAAAAPGPSAPSSSSGVGAQAAAVSGVIVRGDQPDGGTMTVKLTSHAPGYVSPLALALLAYRRAVTSNLMQTPRGNDQQQGQDAAAADIALPGFPAGTRTIVVQYHFKPGKQGPKHPSPGKPYILTGFPRTAYLPYTKKGYECLCMLKIAFDRRLIFTVGHSITSKKSDCIIWAGIHHKTIVRGDPHGYPDKDYLDNLTKELAKVNVTPADIPANPGTALGIGFNSPSLFDLL